MRNDEEHLAELTGAIATRGCNLSPAGEGAADLTTAVPDDYPEAQRPFLDITIATTNWGRSWMPCLDGRPLLKKPTETPLLSAARALQALGHADVTPIRM